jgi:5'-deoxynucleotidase YfbR-like HD superfamily hydrolase
MANEPEQKRNGLLERVRFIMGGGNVRRFHVVSTVHPNTVAQHSWGVAWLTYLLSEGMPSAALLLAAMAHDLAEQHTGDVPSTTKRALKMEDKLDAIERAALHERGLAFKLTDKELSVLNMADRLDGMLYCVQERQLGNKNVGIVYQRYRNYVCAGTSENVPKLFEVMTAVELLWKEASAQ